jgi:uncharacterized Fe-S cluster protein YjdI
MPHRLQRYEGESLVVTFDPDVCTHSARCVKGLPAVFDVKKKPWVTLDGASAAEVEAQVGRCPSGALRVERRGGPEAP